jgi:hypothetical protein
MNRFFPLRVELTKTQTGKEGTQYFYQLWSMDGKKVGATLTIPIKEGAAEPVKSCILSTLDPEDIMRLLEQSQKPSAIKR